MINTSREQLKENIKLEKETYFNNSFKSYVKDKLVLHRYYIIYKYMVALRKSEYYSNNRDKNIFFRLKSYFAERKKNKIGSKIGLEICHNSCEPGVMIEHAGNIVINGEAKLGSGCLLRGSNCIGNNGIDNKNPTIGKNVEIGVGAKIIGDVQIADNTIIGAGAVVVDSFLEPGHVIGGVPAKVIK